MLAVAAVAIVLTAAFYYRAFGMLKSRQWLLLLLLRVVAVLLVVFLLFRPVYSYYRELEQRKTLLFLLDTSSSMSISDGASGVTRFNQARTRIEDWWEKLRDDFDLQLVEFAERVQTVESPEQLAALSPQGKATSISGALDAAARQVAGKDVEALVVFSDGIHNSAGDPVEIASNLGRVVHTVGVGASLRSDPSYRDIQVAAIDCPDRMLLNNLAKVKASVDAVGLIGRVITVVLQEDGQPVGEPRELTLDAVEGAQQVEFEFLPEKKGRHSYTARVEPVGEEKIKENNYRSADALVVEPGIRVLYVEGTIRAEYGAMVQRFFAKDPDLEFCALVQTKPNFFVQRTNITELNLQGIPSDAETINKFDVFIIGDLDASYVRPAQQELIVKRVRAGGGLVMLGGYHSLGPGGWAGSPIGDVLPVELGNREIGQVTVPFLPTLTPEGIRSPIFSGIAGFFPTSQGEAKIAGLPPLDGCTRVAGTRPGATVLAVCPGDSGNLPVLATQRVDKGQTAVFTGDTTRKWQQGPRALDQDSPFLRFWGQLVRYMAGRDTTISAGASVLASTDKAYYEPGEQMLLSAVVRNTEGEAATDAKVVARITGPTGRPDQVSLSAVPGPGGNYSGTFALDTVGVYKIEMVATMGEATVRSEPFGVEFGRPDMEFEKLDLDEKRLGRIAAAADGRYMHISTSDYLLEQFDRSLQKKRIFIERKLYWPPGFWLIFVGVLTVEWILRKRFLLR
jgi:uncharacterized membrane protein